ncbi:hypothetical protein ACFL3Q_11040 [Planctomycetota bacterium]
MSLTLKSLCSRLISVRVRSVPMRVFRPAVRPIVLREESPGLPVALPTVPRVVAFGSRTLVVLLVPIVRPIRELDFTVRERGFVSDCFFVTDIDGVFLPITVPMRRLRSVRIDDWLLLTPGRVDSLVELTAGCFALLGTDGLVVLIVLREESIGLPIREVMLGLIRLLVLVVGFLVVIVREVLLLDGVLVLIELPILDVMLELMRLLEFVLSEAEELLRVLALPTGRLTVLRFDWLGVGELGRVVICRPSVLELGAVVRELIDRLDVLLLELLLLVIALLELLLLGLRLVMDRLEVLLLGVRLVIARLELLLLGARLVIDLLDMLLLGVRLVMDRLDELLLGALLVTLLLEVLLLGVRLVVTRLELRLDETLLERLDDDLDEDLGAGAGFEADRLLELRDLLLLDFDLAAITGSQNNKRANRVQKARKSDPPRRDSTTLILDFWLLTSEF